jgi:hypothetical protein
VFEVVLRQLRHGGKLYGAELPSSVWEEVTRRSKEGDVMTILCKQLNRETKSLLLTRKRADSETFSQAVGEKTWTRWINKHQYVYNTIFEAREALGDDVNYDWLQEDGDNMQEDGDNMQEDGDNFGTLKRYGKNITERQLLTWLDTNRISNKETQKLLHMLKASWWNQEDMESSTLPTLRHDLDAAANSMIQSSDLRVSSDGKQSVIFYYRNPVQVLQLVSANSVCRTCHACTFAHPTPQLHIPQRFVL